MSKIFKPYIIVLLILLIDQLSKFWVKTTMVLGEDIEIFNWFYIRFVENNGMAFGMELGGSFGKIFLSLFRIVAVGAIIWYIRNLKKTGAPFGLIVSMSLILAGAMGNIIDSVVYGVIFTESYGQVAQLFPAEGYASLLHGRVVDMFYFPLIRGAYPSWFPFFGGQSFEFFRPVFNVADSSISIGVGIIIAFQRHFFKMMPKNDEPETSESFDTNKNHSV